MSILRRGPFALIIVLALVLSGTGCFQRWFHLTPAEEIALGILFVAAILWVSELVPLFVTSLIILLLELVWLMPSILETGGSVTSRDFMSPFFSNIILLFMGGFVLSILLHRYGIDLRIARVITSKTKGDPAKLLVGVMLVSAVLSMWMSNTATTAMMFAIMLPLIQQIPAENRFAKALALAIPFACNLGGMGTPIGSPPNAIALGHLSKVGIEISFATWMMLTLPFLLLLLAVLWQILSRLYPAGDFRFKITEQRQTPMQRKDWLVVVIFLVTCITWLTTKYHGLATGTVSLILLIIVFGSRILTQEDFRGMSWDVLFMIGGGLALGVGLKASGLTNEIVGWLPAKASFTTLLLTFAIIAGLMTTFMSNSATANLIVPIAVSLGGEIGVIAMGITIMCSSAMALPVSTPPNAIAFGSGLLKSRDMILVGGMVSLVALLLVGVLGKPYWALFGF